MHIVPIAPDIDPALAIREGDIRRIFPPSTLTAGRSYEQRGRVQELEISERGAVITATTQGTQPDPYVQSLKVSRSPDQRHPDRRRLLLPGRARLQTPRGGADRGAAQATARIAPPGSAASRALNAADPSKNGARSKLPTRQRRLPVKDARSGGAANPDPKLAGGFRPGRGGTDRRIPGIDPHPGILRARCRPARRRRAATADRPDDRDPAQGQQPRHHQALRPAPDPDAGEIPPPVRPDHPDPALPPQQLSGAAGGRRSARHAVAASWQPGAPAGDRPKVRR